MQRGKKSLAALATIPVDGVQLPLHPPASLNEAQRAVFVHVVTAVKPGHLQGCDLPLLVRYCEIVVMCDHAAKKLAADIVKNRPSHWLMTHERLTKTQVMLGRQLRLSPLARSPSKNGRAEVIDPYSSNGGRLSVYERMRLQDGRP
jgi:hypothetical protein